jgi:hypothetical protein
MYTLSKSSPSIKKRQGSFRQHSSITTNTIEVVEIDYDAKFGSARESQSRLGFCLGAEATQLHELLAALAALR